MSFIQWSQEKRLLYLLRVNRQAQTIHMETHLPLKPEVLLTVLEISCIIKSDSVQCM